MWDHCLCTEEHTCKIHIDCTNILVIFSRLNVKILLRIGCSEVIYQNINLALILDHFLHHGCICFLLGSIIINSLNIAAFLVQLVRTLSSPLHISCADINDCALARQTLCTCQSDTSCRCSYDCYFSI